ncbi:MAG: hypothetical protein ACE5JL_12055 [Dehalococcoidia bacterium]
MPERWDCIYVDRIAPNGRIYLTQPQKYGFMYRSRGQASDEARVRKAIPPECGQLKGTSNENKILIAVSIAAALNQDKLKSSEGLVVRGFIGQTPFPGLQTALIQTKRKNLRVQGSTGWIVYISPEERFFAIAKGRCKGDEIIGQQSDMIHDCIASFEKTWM